MWCPSTQRGGPSHSLAAASRVPCRISAAATSASAATSPKVSSATSGACPSLFCTSSDRPALAVALQSPIASRLKPGFARLPPALETVLLFRRTGSAHIAAERRRTLAVGASPRGGSANVFWSRGAAAENGPRCSVAAPRLRLSSGRYSAGWHPRLNSLGRSAAIPYPSVQTAR
jgi:hypothetical protein